MQAWGKQGCMQRRKKGHKVGRISERKVEGNGMGSEGKKEGRIYEKEKA